MCLCVFEFVCELVFVSILSAVNLFDNTTKELSWLQQIVHGFYWRWLSTKKVLCTHTKTNYNYIFTGRIATVLQYTARFYLNKIQKNAFFFIVFFCIFPLRFYWVYFSLSLVLPWYFFLFFFSFWVFFMSYFWNIQCNITDIFCLYGISLEFFFAYSLYLLIYNFELFRIL